MPPYKWVKEITKSKSSSESRIQGLPTKLPGLNPNSKSQGRKATASAHISIKLFTKLGSILLSLQFYQILSHKITTNLSRTFKNKESKQLYPSVKGIPRTMSQRTTLKTRQVRISIVTKVRMRAVISISQITLSNKSYQLQLLIWAKTLLKNNTPLQSLTLKLTNSLIWMIVTTLKVNGGIQERIPSGKPLPKGKRRNIAVLLLK